MRPSPEWWKKPRKVSVVVDNDSWVVPHTEKLVQALNDNGDEWSVKPILYYSSANMRLSSSFGLSSRDGLWQAFVHRLLLAKSEG